VKVHEIIFKKRNSQPIKMLFTRIILNENLKDHIFTVAHVRNPKFEKWKR